MRNVTIDINANAWHEGTCTVSYGATGKARPTLAQRRWRRNGATRTWKRDPERFEVPIKHGMYQYATIDAHNASYFHDEATCPAAAEMEAYWEAHR